MFRWLSILLCLVMSSISFAQEKTGNIVEYFGKEKVNDVSEGEVLHVFNDGLAITVPRVGFNSSSFPEDPVFATFLKSNYRPLEKDVFGVDGSGRNMSWFSIEANDKSTFDNQSLRSSYVYLEYDSKKEQMVLFEASGHSLALINGYPHEGDHYDFGWSLVPIQLKKGRNTFVLKNGRFPRVRARLIKPKSEVILTTRDMTLPDLLVDEANQYMGAIRVVNTSDHWLKDLRIKAELKSGNEITTDIYDIPPLLVRKVPFNMSSPDYNDTTGKYDLRLSLIDQSDHILDETTIKVNLKTKTNHHKRTFRSKIDNSIQYYSVAPSTSGNSEGDALFLSVHGASVEAVNQANAYKKKDWGNLVAPTNRRPFGFAWEDWGRIDAMEVLDHASSHYNPDPQKVYLTGHSMGGHGTWYLGATYPSRFAAIAPCAGYPDLLSYRDSFIKRIKSWTKADLFVRGITPKMFELLTKEESPTEMEKMIARAGNPSRTLKLKDNYKQHGIYVLHGENDNVVPTDIAREMRKVLGTYHSDFVYYEYPNGEHWYGNHSVDWGPIFDYFKWHTIPISNELESLSFSTAVPGVSASSHFITIYQQQEPFEISKVEFESKDKKAHFFTENVKMLALDLDKINKDLNTIVIDSTSFNRSELTSSYFRFYRGSWQASTQPSLKQKGPHRNGGFKDAFNNHFVLVYATQADEEEKNWWKKRAYFDAETFSYRANGSVEVIADVDFELKQYADRNVVIYGNKSNNKAWSSLLSQSAIQLSDDRLTIGSNVLTGSQWGAYFITARPDSDIASVGVVSATGMRGARAAYMNHYLVNGTTFPDFTIFDDDVLENGVKSVKCAGFFGNDWNYDLNLTEWK